MKRIYCCIFLLCLLATPFQVQTMARSTTKTTSDLDLEEQKKIAAQVEQNERDTQECFSMINGQLAPRSELVEEVLEEQEAILKQMHRDHPEYYAVKKKIAAYEKDQKEISKRVSMLVKYIEELEKQSDYLADLMRQIN